MLAREVGVGAGREERGEGQETGVVPDGSDTQRVSQFVKDHILHVGVREIVHVHPVQVDGRNHR